MPHPIFDHEHPDYITPSLNAFGIETAECIINKNSYKFFHKQWKSYRKTMLMKEILKQLKGVK